MSGLLLDLPAGVVPVDGAGPVDAGGGPVEQWWAALVEAVGGLGADLVAVGRLPDGPVVALTVVHRAELDLDDDVEDTVGALAAEGGAGARCTPVPTAFGAGVAVHRRVLAEHERRDGSVGGGALDVVQLLGPGAGPHSLLVLTAASPAGSPERLAAWVERLALTARAEPD